MPLTRFIRRLWPAGVLALIALAFFWPMLLAGRWIPQGGGDLVSFLWPQYSFAAQSIRAGSIPLWNPHLYSGAPFLADNQSGVLYPINLLAFLIFPQLTYQVMELLVVLHIWLAGVAMYAALRLWPLTPQTARGARAAADPSPEDSFSVVGRGEIARVPALLGAIAYMLNDVMVTHVGNLNLIAVAAWMPLTFGLFARGLHDRRLGLMLGASVTFSIALLAGHAQMTAITLIGLIAIGLWQLVTAPTWRTRTHVMGLAGLALIVALGLTAAQLLPSIEMTRYSLRAGLSYEEATAYSLPPAALASIFSPLLFGRGPADFWGPWQRVETGYLGVIPLLLASFAFRRRQSHGVWFLSVLGVLGLLIALGKYTPIYSLVHALPVLNGLRVPARFVLLIDFALAALAAIGLNRLLTSTWKPAAVMRRSAVALVVGSASLIAAYQSVQPADHTSNLVAALIVFGVVGALGSLIIGRGSYSTFRTSHSARLVAIAGLELIALGSTIEIDANDPTLGYDHQAAVHYLRSDSNVFRIEDAAPNAWQPDAALMYDLYDIGGIFNPLGLANYETYRGGMGDRGSALYNLLGVKYVLAPKGEPPGDASFVPVFDADPAIDVYLNTRALPRAQLIDHAQVVSSGEAAWQALHAPGFDPSSSVIVEGGATLSSAGAVAGPRALSFGQVTNDRVELNVQTDSPVYLVLSNVYYPGWSATIDQQPVQVLPADFAFQAVRVPAGSHFVVFRFDPITWHWGVLITGLTIAGLLLFGGWRLWYD